MRNCIVIPFWIWFLTAILPLPACEENPSFEANFIVGIVHQGGAFASDTSLTIYQSQLSGKAPEVNRITASLINAEPSSDFPPRWKIGYGELMLANASPPIFKNPGWRRKDFFAFGIPVSAINDRIARNKDINNGSGHSGPIIATEYEFGNATNGVWCDHDYYLLDAIYSDIRSYVMDEISERKVVNDPPFSKVEFFYDILPVKAGASDCVVLASEAIQEDIEATRKNSIGKRPMSGMSKHPATNGTRKWREAKEPLKPMLGVWHKDERDQWALTEQIKDPSFNERFHVFVQRTTYFFVTDSGKVYLSKKPEKDERKLEEVWNKRDQPIVGAITDTASGKTFLFGRKGKADAKDAKMFYFELSEKPELVDFTADVLVHKKMPEPLETVMSYAYLLIADKKIKIEPKPEPKPDPKP